MFLVRANLFPGCDDDPAVTRHSMRWWFNTRSLRKEFSAIISEVPLGNYRFIVEILAKKVDVKQTADWQFLAVNGLMRPKYYFSMKR